jgi:hypothetical protein
MNEKNIQSLSSEIKDLELRMIEISGLELLTDQEIRLYANLYAKLQYLIDEKTRLLENMGAQSSDRLEINYCTA